MRGEKQTARPHGGRRPKKIELDMEATKMEIVATMPEKQNSDTRVYK